MACARGVLRHCGSSLRGPVYNNTVARTHLFAGSRWQSSITDSLPRVAQPSLWTSLVPKPLRSSGNSVKQTPATRSNEWNPATFYIIIFLLIGSNAINMIALDNDYVKFSRHADEQLRKLREVIELVRRGEKVDVEAMLGTGDPKREQEWADILKEIETSERDYLAERKKRNDRYKGKKVKEEQAIEDTQEKQSPSDSNAETPNYRPAGFY